MRLFKKRNRDKPDNCPYCNESSDRLFYKHVAYAHQHETATQACGTPMLRAQQLADEESAVEHATNDDIYDAAVELVRERQRASTAILQRHFRIGYTRAARLIDRMEDENIIGPAIGSEPRKVN